MAWQPPEESFDDTKKSQWSPPEESFDDTKKTQWSPPEESFDDSSAKIKDVGALKQMKDSGQQLTREQERILFDAEDKKPFTQKASEAITTFVPTAFDIAKQLGSGAGEFIYKGVLKPIDAMSQSPEEAEKTLKEAGNMWRSGAHGAGQGVQEAADAGVRFAMFGSDFTDKLLGRSENERFEKYMLRQGMREFSQKVYEDNPDAAARLLSENPLLQKMAYAAALAQGGTKEEAELAQKAYSELVLESGLKKEDINENVALFAEVLSPLSLPGTNTATKFLNKGTTKVVQKTGELALKGLAAPVAKGVEKTAGAVEAAIEGAQNLSRKIGEYTVGDPDTLLKASVTTAAAPVKIPAKMVRGIARTVYDVASEARPGRIGMFERAGRKADAGELTKKLFSSEALGGKGRARIADWAVRQANAIVQPAVNGAVLNVALGLPDIESATDLGYMAGVGAGIGGFGGSRLQERGMALFDPTTSLAQKIDAVVTPDPMGLRRDQDADIKRFLSTADSSLVDSINELSNVDNIKSALEVKIKNLEGRRDAQIRKEDERRIQKDIDNLKAQRIELEKVTPQTESEIKRQVQLSFADAMDLAKTTGAAAGLNNIEVKVLKPEQMDQFYREKYGKTLTDAESVVKQLVGNPNLSPSEQELLTRADATIRQYLSDVAGASTARGFAISERPDAPEHLRMQNQKGATVVINGDLVSQMGRDGLNLSRVINHEMQHALSNFTEVRQMLDPIRKQLFDQKIQNPDGTFEVVSKGMIPDAELDKYALQYAAGMDASGGGSFLGQFANQDQLRAYMKDEVLSELAGLSGASHGDLRSGLDSVGRQAVDWLETKTKTGALKTIKEGLRQFGIGFDDQGKFTSVLGTNLPPEAFSMMRQYQRKLRDLNESLVYNSSPLKDAPEIPLTELATNRALQERYKHSDFFEQEQVVTLESPDGSKQEVVVPAGTNVDQFVGEYRFANGQLVDEQGNPVSLGPDFPLQAMPDGTSVSLDTRIARNPDGSPRILSPRESKRRAKQRGEIIRKAIDDAPDDKSGVRLEDMGNGNYRGTLSPTQIAAINALPNDLVAPSLKRKIAFFNDILGRKDGSIVEIEYQAALRDGKYRALKPQLRTEIPIGFQFDKQGNFLMTTMSLSRMYDKANAWAAKSPRNLRLWGGDMTKFWDSVRQYLMNHQKGLQGHIGLNPDPYISLRMKNRINDLFNVYRKETREANPERTTLPKRRGQDPMDVVIRSRRMDRINSFDETALPKMPFQYELAVQNYLPAENPFAELQEAQQFAKAMEVDEDLVNRAIAGDIEPLELQLHEQDLLRPAEYIDVSNGKIRVRSMFDPTQAIFEQGESNPESPAQLQFMPAVAVVPERFTGKPEDERRGRYVAPPSFFQKFDIGEYERGGKFFDLETGEEITDKIYQTGTIDISGKSPKLVSEQSAEDLGDGKTYKTNLFKKSAGWEWISENPPEVASIGKNPVLISVEGGKEHKYALKVDFTNGVQLKRYADKPSEPRLRPTGKGDLNLGNVVGEIDIRGKQHPVYDSIIIGTQFLPAEVDTRYIDLETKAKAGDKEAEAEAQRMVDEAAKKAGYEIPVYHGSDEWQGDEKDFVEFGQQRTATGYYFAPDERTAEYYAPNGIVKKLYIKIDKLADLTNPQDFNEIAKEAIWETDPDVLSEEIARAYDAHEATGNDWYMNYQDDFVKTASNLGFDGVFMYDASSTGTPESYVIFDPQNAKSAEPFTYDDAGNLIPLSERFQPTSPDIRFLPAEQGAEPEGLQGIELPQTYRRISDMIPPLRDIETPVRLVQEMPAEKAESAANDLMQYRDSLNSRIQSGTEFSNAVVAPPGIQYLPAWHGSPFDFDKFSIGKIGEGEGAQAYGWGLYFAGLRQVSEGYQTKLAKNIRIDGVESPSEDVIQNQQIRDLFGILTDALKTRKSGLMLPRKTIDRAIRMLEDEKDAATDNTYAEEILNWWFNAGVKGLKDPSKIQVGSLYKVDIDVEEGDLLDWDKPLSEQSKKVQDAVLPTIINQFDQIKKAREAIIQRGTRLGGRPFRPGELEQLQKPMRDPLSLTGKAAYVNITNAFGGRPSEDAPKASKFLLEQGVPGIRYWDAFSRGVGEGTSNYVVFDDKLIKILEKDDKPVGPITQFMPPEEQLPDKIKQSEDGEMAILKQALQGITPVVQPEKPVEKINVSSAITPIQIAPEDSVFISEKALREFDSLGNKNATQVDADNMKYPVNKNPDSISLPGRWGLVNAKIVGMPKTFKQVSEIIDRQVNRLVRLVNAMPEFAKESARFYRDMAESATMITDAAFPALKGKDKFLHDELVLRFLALGSPRTAVSANATKSAGSVAALIDEYEAGYKIGFGEQSHGAKTTYNAWKEGGHFDLSLPGVQDKVRSFYLNSLAELIEMAEAKGDSVSVEELMVRAGKSMRVIDPGHSSKLTDAEKKEIQRLLDGKATIDMWDMAAKGWAWPGYIIFKNRRNSVKQPFQWSQDDFEKIGTFADKSWKQVMTELGIKSPDQLRYQQARALRIDGNPDWTKETWDERKSQAFLDSTKFSYYTQGTESGLSPGGGGPLYDAQQAIDGLLADRLNELGLAPLFGKTKLKARNAQEILWALEKLDNPIEANNDLSLFGNTFEPFLNEVLKLRSGQSVDPKSRAENVLAAMERAYAAMAQQMIPIEVVSGGTTEEAKRIQDAIQNLQNAGDPDAATTLTLHVADGLGNAINDLAIKHGIKATIENVDVGEGGYTENKQVNVAPNIRVILRGKPTETFLVLETLSRAMDQDGGNVIRKPTMRELNDSRVNKNLILTIPTTGLNQAQRNKMFLDLSALKDANGDSFLTGFTEVDGGIAIGNQFYSGDYKKAISDNKTNIDQVLKNYNQDTNKADLDIAIIQTFYRGQASTKIEPEKIMVKKKEVLRPSFASDLYEYIKNRMTNIPLARSRPSFAQKTDFEKNWIDKADTLFSRLKSYPVKKEQEIKKAKLEAPDIASNTKRTAALVALKSELETALLRDQISEDVANKLKARYGFKEENQPKGEE